MKRQQIQERIMLTTKSICTAVLLLALISSAHAHYVWLERDGGEAARAYFGEWQLDIREKAGGSLDRIKTPRAFIFSASRDLSIERRSDHLEIAAKGAGDVRLVESGLASREDKEKAGKTRTIYYARAGRTETVASLDLELVPTTSNGSNFVLLFRGAPLAKTSVKVFGPPKWEKPLDTDEQGRITVPTPWRGRYVLEVVHFDDKPGETGSDKFDRTRHIATLSFVNTKGQPWPAIP
jgi:hypothetical protein